MLTSPLGYAGQWIITYIAIGIAFYFFDRKIVVPSWRWIRELGREQPLPPERHVGFLFGRKSRWKVTVAVILSTAQSIYMFWSGTVHPWTELLLWFGETPAMLLGFMLGYPLHQMYLRRTVAYDAIDRMSETMERVDLEKLGSDARKASEQATSKVVGVLASFGLAIQAWGLEFISAFRKKSQSVPVSAPQAQTQASGGFAAAQAVEDPMEAILRFRKRMRG